jgi:hypothetical protein
MAWTRLIASAQVGVLEQPGQPDRAALDEAVQGLRAGSGIRLPRARRSIPAIRDMPRGNA